MKTIIAIIAAAGALTATAAHAEGTQQLKQPGSDKVAMCIGCHGIPGYRTAFPEVYSVPEIGGQNKAYLVAALKAYRDGDRPHPSMQGIARGLSEQDMEDVATYYANK